MNTTFIMARKMEKNRLAAARIRIRYLMDEAIFWTQDVSEIGDWYAEKCYEEIIYLLKHAYTEPAERRQKNRVTEEQIEAAKNYPVDKLIPFVRGKAVAWCHDDRKPSLYLASRTGLACCPVCQKYFNAVDVLVSRDGFRFYDAVRELAA